MDFFITADATLLCLFAFFKNCWFNGDNPFAKIMFSFWYNSILCLTTTGAFVSKISCMVAVSILFSIELKVVTEF